MHVTVGYSIFNAEFFYILHNEYRCNMAVSGQQDYNGKLQNAGSTACYGNYDRVFWFPHISCGIARSATYDMRDYDEEWKAYRWIICAF